MFMPEASVAVEPARQYLLPWTPEALDTCGQNTCLDQRPAPAIACLILQPAHLARAHMARLSPEEKHLVMYCGAARSGKAGETERTHERARTAVCRPGSHERRGV